MTLHRTRIKLCGVTRVADAEHAVDCGVDAIGMIFHPPSPRNISIEQAQQIRQVVPAFVTLVGVFVDVSAELINQTAAQIGLDLVQLHGNETNDFGRCLNTPFIKAIRAKNAAQVATNVRQFADARAILLDPYVKGLNGGTGHQLNPEFWPHKHSQPLILAGGLAPNNLASALTQLQPYALDINSGVESQAGIKDNSLLEQAVGIVRAHAN